MFIGRDYELGNLGRAIHSDRAELIVVYGRRRVGKSELLRHVAPEVERPLIFEALQEGSGRDQIRHFLYQLSVQTGLPPFQAENWQQAFDALSTQICEGTQYVVFDEFPWMARGRSELVSLLKFFWDNRWKQNSGLTLVLCGSVASFMLKHIVHSKALHNRKTLELKLPPLPAGEAQGFFRTLRSDFELVKFLMVFGGIPKYLEQVDPSQSLAANLDRLCFQRDGFFVNEFATVFKEQFKVTKTYEAIATVLSEKSLSRQQLAAELGITAGGGLGSYIDNLEHAGFVRTFSPYQVLGRGAKTKKIVLWDEWLRFYFTYVSSHLPTIALNTQAGLFEQLTANSFDTYCGLAFERFCMCNIEQLLKALEIPLSSVLGFGPYFKQPPRKPGNGSGCQIDILIHRRGHVLTLIECKFTTGPVGLNVGAEVQRKVRELAVPQHYSIERVLVSAAGVTRELERSGDFHRILGLRALLAV